MASIDLEDEALIEQDYYGDDDYDDDEGAPEMPPMVAPLSPLASHNEAAGNEASTEGGALEGLLGEPDGGADGDAKPRRIVKRKPQPKLDEELLTGPRGLPSLEKHFKRVHFKGKGHEVSDLNLLMVEMEHWLNRLYPRLTLREMITKMERFGRKQKVKTCISKIRLDMPILPEDFVGAEEIPDDVLRGDVVEGLDRDDDDDDDVVRRAGDEEQGDQVTSSQPQNKTTLTEEQKRRIEDKKREALERKAAKRAKLAEDGNGLSQEEADSVLADLSLSQTEKKMMREIDEMEAELSGQTHQSSTYKDLYGNSQKSSTKPDMEKDVAENGLTNEEMDEIERELMG